MGSRREETITASEDCSAGTAEEKPIPAALVNRWRVFDSIPGMKPEPTGRIKPGKD